MPHAQRLRLSDVRQAMRVVGECRELGRDPVRWRTHLCERLIGVVGGLSGRSFEVGHPLDGRPPRIFVDVGFEPKARRILHTYLNDPAWGRDPMPLAIKSDGRPSLTFARHELLPDHVWYGSPAVSEVRRAAGVDHCIASHRVLSPHGIADELSVDRPVGDRPFGRRERRLVGLVHTELAGLWTRPSSPSIPPEVAELPPQTQRVFGLLAKGNSERQVAAKLGIAVSTVHTHVKVLHKRLNVSSRAELLVRYLPEYDFVPRLTTPLHP